MQPAERKIAKGAAKYVMQYILLCAMLKKRQNVVQKAPAAVNAECRIWNAEYGMQNARLDN